MQHFDDWSDVPHTKKTTSKPFVIEARLKSSLCDCKVWRVWKRYATSKDRDKALAILISKSTALDYRVPPEEFDSSPDISIVNKSIDDYKNGKYNIIE